MENKKGKKQFVKTLVFTKFQIVLFGALKLFNPNHFSKKLFGEKRLLVYLRTNKPELIS